MIELLKANAQIKPNILSKYNSFLYHSHLFMNLKYTTDQMFLTCLSGCKATSQDLLISKLESFSLADSATVVAIDGRYPGGDASSHVDLFL